MPIRRVKPGVTKQLVQSSLKRGRTAEVAGKVATSAVGLGILGGAILGGAARGEPSSYSPALNHSSSNAPFRDLLVAGNERALSSSRTQVILDESAIPTIHLPPAEVNTAQALLAALSPEGRAAFLAALGIQDGKDAGQQVVSAAGEKGLSFSPEGLVEFQRLRQLPADGQLTMTTVDRLARAVQGQEVLFDVSAQLDASQQNAVAVYAAMDAGSVKALMASLGVQSAPSEGVARQMAALGDAVVTTDALNALVGHAAQKGVSLDAAGIERLRFLYQLGPGSSVDPTTAQTLIEELGPIGARPADTLGKANWYRRIVQSQGYAWDTAPNQVNAIGLRGYDIDSGRNDNMFNQWNDTLAFVWYDEAGAPQVFDVRATTDNGLPTVGPDVNGDGTGDGAQLPATQYLYYLGTHMGQSGAGRMVGEMSAANYDTDHDGNISDAEAQASKERGDTAEAINIHWNTTGDKENVGGSSAGCQVADLSIDEFRSAITPILQRDPQSIRYSLIDVSLARNTVPWA